MQSDGEAGTARGRGLSPVISRSSFQPKLFCASILYAEHLVSKVSLDNGYYLIPTKVSFLLFSHFSYMQCGGYVEGNGNHRDGVFSVWKQLKNSFKTEGITTGAKT